MKKIISLLASVAMLASMFTSVSAAELANNNPVIDTVVEEMAADDAWFAENEYVLEAGQKAYRMTVNLTGVDLSIQRYDSSTNGKKGRVGVVVQQLTYKLTDIVGEDNIVEIIALDEGIAPQASGFVSSLDASNVATSYPVQTNNNTAAAVEATEALVNDYIVVTNGEEITGNVYITLKISVVAYDTEKKSSYFPGGDQTKEWKTSNGSMTVTVNGENTGVVTLAAAGSDEGDDGDEGEEVTEINPTKYNLLANGGYAWDVVIENYDSEKTYATIFTDGDETRTVGDNVLTFPAETEGDIAFAILMKTARENVELKIQIQ